MKIIPYFIIVILLSAGISAYSQTARPVKAVNTEKHDIKKESVKQKSGLAKWLFGEKKQPSPSSPVAIAKKDTSVNQEIHRSPEDFMKSYADYNLWYKYRVIRPILYDTTYHQLAIEIRQEKFPYRQPILAPLIWSPLLINQYKFYYPAQAEWKIEEGQKIETISAYEVWKNVGTVSRVYGKVQEVYFSSIDENYVLYIGDHFPYQDMSIVIPYIEMRKITRHPESYFKNQDIWINGLIALWDGKPEISVRCREQISRY